MIPAYYSEIAVLLLGVVLLMLEAFLPRGDRRVLGYIGFFGLVAILVATILFKPAAPGAAPLWHFYTADPLSLLFKQIALATTAIVLVMMIEFAPALDSPKATQQGLGEFFSIPLFTCAGLMWMSSAVDFVMIFVSLELVTISFYVLVAFTRRNPLTLEAGVKYLVLSALSTGFLVYGITWIFGATGETSLQRIAAAFATSNFERSAALFGGVLVIIALGFKIAAVPFHIWVADVYQGAPTPVTAFLSVGSKAAGFVVLLRVLQTFLVLPELRSVLVALALLTLLYGNLAALSQSNMKRLLAYSSIAHAGYLLVAVVSFSGDAIAFYLVAYLLMTLLAFIVLVLVKQNQLDDFNGLSQRAPLLAFAMLVAMASLAGVPFTAGFLGKFLVFQAALAQKQFALVIVGVITVGAGFYYYFKVVRAMYWDKPTSADPISILPITRVVLFALIAAIFVLGVYPQPILNALR